MSTVNQDLKQVRPFCRLPNQAQEGWLDPLVMGQCIEFIGMSCRYGYD